MLSDIWLAKPETARRVRQGIGSVLDWATPWVIVRRKRLCARSPRGFHDNPRRRGTSLPWLMRRCPRSW
ncbi:hypothetical protein [Sphingobium sp. SJ10-10]|uniref:hypothetical protein n=1 Tax=Sphingobium sp. SJ10-10 TaxID=3114999 RepID=UPI00386A1744